MTTLDDVRALIGEALAMATRSSKAKGDWPDGTLPATRAAKVLRITLDEVVPQDLTRDRPPGLGLSRGAGDLVWDPDDLPIVDKLYEIEAAWDAAFEAAKARYEDGQ
ncbi:MAG: hypothetical protein QM679_11215 [Patulibacter sp.]